MRQAQVFCDGHFEVWDPKITTPPGLYLLSTIVNKVTGRCDITTLRAVNCVAICTISLVVFSIFRKLSQSQTYSVKTTTSSVDVVDGLVAAIIALFPPLFFFSALYYTDVVSTLLVLVHYNIFLRSRTHQSFSASIQLIIVGLLALLYRQTNIFWVAVFPAGLSIIQRFETQLEISTSYSEILQKSWSQSKLYTLPVEDASVEGRSEYYRLYRHRLMLDQRLYSVPSVDGYSGDSKSIHRPSANSTISGVTRRFRCLRCMERRCSSR